MFLEKTWRYIRGYINVKIEGYFVERFLNLCMNRQIELWNIKRLNEAELTVNIKYIDFDKVKEVADITRCRLIKNSSRGVPDLAVRYKKRKVFIFIFILAVICIKLYSARIWQLEIIGDFTIPISELWNELELEGVRIGMKKVDLDYDKIKNNIYVRRDDVAWMGFYVKGTKAYVEFVQRDNIPEDDLKNEPCNIIADKDGIIHKILVKSGQRVVSVGDSITKGQVLISGAISNQKNESRLVHSDGEVIIKTWYTNKVTVPYEKDLVNKTGNKERKYKLEIGNCEINLINSGTKFEKYDTITVSNKLRVLNRFELPIKLTELVYEEVEVDTVKYTKTQAESIAKNDAVAGLNKLIPSENEGVSEYDYKITENADSISVEVTVECLEKVGIKEIIK